MERLTTNKNVSEMGMYELAHNSCYYKDGSARYRDFESDIDARELTSRLLKKYAEGDDSFVDDDDDFDEEMIELLQYGTETIEGLIALFYRNLWAMADLRERLKGYEDKDEQGLFIRLPCNVGDTIYSIMPHDNFIMKSTVEEFVFSNMVYVIVRDELFNSRKGIPYCEKGKTWFLTKEEAEEALNNETEGK